jgi:hypothetical protein
MIAELVQEAEASTQIQNIVPLRLQRLELLQQQLPLSLSISEISLVDALESGQNLRSEQVPKSRVQV